MPGPDELQRMAAEEPMEAASAEFLESLTRLDDGIRRFNEQREQLMRDCFDPAESDLDYFLRRRRETQLNDKPPEPPTKKLVFDFKSGELMVAPVDESVPRQSVVLDQIYDTGFFGSIA